MRTVILFVCVFLLLSLILLNKTAVYDSSIKFGVHLFFMPRASNSELFNLTSSASLFNDFPSTSSMAASSSSAANDSFMRPSDDVNRAPNVYAIISSDTHFEYLFPLPIVILSWRRIGVNAIIILIGTRSQYENNTKLAYILRAIEEMKVKLIFLGMEKTRTDTFTLAQTARLFVAGIAGLSLNDSDILVTADADMFSFTYDEHVPDVRKGKQVFLYNSRCCGQQHRHGSVHNHIPMNTIAATVRIWREIMNISENSIACGDDIVRRLNDEFGEEVVTGPGFRGSIKWGMDQKLVSTQLYEWNISRIENAGLIAEHEKVPPHTRFDRSRWAYNFRSLTLSGFSDAHFPHPIYGHFWSSVRGLLRLLFSDSTYAWCEYYRNGFLRTFPNESALYFNI